MPRKPPAPQPELPFDVTSRSTELVAETETGASKPARKLGRPRKWSSEAERKRAYRERRAADLAEPERLRRELRNANRRVADRDRRIVELERQLVRVEADIEHGSARESDLRGVIERLEAQVEHWRSQAKREVAERTARSTGPGSPAVASSRRTTEPGTTGAGPSSGRRSKNKRRRRR